MNYFINPPAIPEQIRCRNAGCVCAQSNYDNHPEGKAPPTYIYHLPEEVPNVSGWREKHSWYHLCWELGIEDPFCTETEVEVRARTINVLRQMHQEIFNLRRELRAYELEEAKEYAKRFTP